MKGFFDTGVDTQTREPDASELERTLWMRSMLGGDIPAGTTDALTQRIRERFFPRGSSLYRQGDAADRIFFIVSGRVALVHGGIKTREFGPRDVLGVIDALQSRPHAFDALVRDDTVVLQLDFDDWLEFLEDNFEFARSIILRLAGNLEPTSPPGVDLGRPTARLRTQRERRQSAPPQSHRAHLGPQLALSFVERLAVLRACPPLMDSDIQALSRLARFAELIYLDEEQQQILLPPSLCVVEAGKIRSVASSSDGNTWTEELGAGGAIAGLGLLQPGLYDVEVTALEPSSIFRIPTERLFDVMEDHFQLVLSFFKHLSAESEAQALERQRGSQRSTSSLVPPSAPSRPGGGGRVGAED